MQCHLRCDATMVGMCLHRRDSVDSDVCILGVAGIHCAQAEEMD